MKVTKNAMTRESNQRSAPTWVVAAAAACGFLTLLFFMALLVASVLGYGMPAESRDLVVIVLSLGLGLSAAFLGGAATLEGRIPLPFVQARPFAFAVSGGVAVVFISSILGHWLYVPAQTASIEQQMEIVEDGHVEKASDSRLSQS